MDKELLNRLTEKINEGSATEEELNLFNAYMNHLVAVNRRDTGDANRLSTGDPDWAEMRPGGSESVKKELWSAIETNVFMGNSEPVQQIATRIFPWKRIAVAASILLVAGAGLWFYTNIPRHPDAGQDPESAQYATDIAPGKNTATLTLADGKPISLSDAKTGIVVDESKLAYSDGTVIPSSLRDEAKQSQLITASTPRGGTYQVVLPDGTKVWLNAASSIKFPSDFKGANRVVELTGEAYLEVAKDKAHPFIVESKGQQVEVLGTHFNISAYPEEGNTKTTLLEGSVRVSSLSPSSLRGGTTRQSQQAITLRPNQQSTMTGSKIDIKTIDPTETIAWKDGYFRFNDEKIESIMRKVSRWYDVDVEFKGEITKEGFNGAITRYSSIRDVLEIMEGSKAVHFKIEGRRIIVSK
jgi:transmembrane sensor